MTALPAPTTPDPMDAPTLRWGILAPGGIATAFATALLAETTQQIVACGSRSRDRAREFASRLGGFTAYGSYDELVADPAVDVVYVASPHSEHHRHALLSLRAGKPVLVCGNGGSAADAMHITGELVGRFLIERHALNVICLSSNPAVLTA